MEIKGKHGSSASLQSYRPYGETLMIPRVKTTHGPHNGSHPGAAERGEMPNRDHQLLDYLEGRVRISFECLE